jgi:hypothetical protein
MIEEILFRDFIRGEAKENKVFYCRMKDNILRKRTTKMSAYVAAIKIQGVL